MGTCSENVCLNITVSLKNDAKKALKKFEGIYNYAGTHGVHNAGVWIFSNDGNYSISSQGAKDWRLAQTKNNKAWLKLKSTSEYGSCPTDKNTTWKYCSRPTKTDIGCNLFDWVEANSTEIVIGNTYERYAYK